MKAPVKMDGGLLIEWLVKVERREQRIDGNDFAKVSKIVDAGQQVKQPKIVNFRAMNNYETTCIATSSISFDFF